MAPPRSSAPLGPAPSGLRGRARAFTLLELLLVLALLLTVLGFAAPTLARFFRGRELDSEVFRFLALTRHGQSRAVSEGVPMVLWVDPEQRRYGLEAEPTYVEQDDQALEFAVAEAIEIEVLQPRAVPGLAEPAPELSRQPASPDSRRPVSLENVYWLRFMPEGGLPETGPEWIAFHHVRDEEVQATLWVAPARNRLRYEIWTNEPPPLAWR